MVTLWTTVALETPSLGLAGTTVGDPVGVPFRKVRKILGKFIYLFEGLM